MEEKAKKKNNLIQLHMFEYPLLQNEVHVAFKVDFTRVSQVNLAIPEVQDEAPVLYHFMYSGCFCFQIQDHSILYRTVGNPKPLNDIFLSELLTL